MSDHEKNIGIAAFITGAFLATTLFLLIMLTYQTLGYDFCIFNK